jgi:hypothetical protein
MKSTTIKERSSVFGADSSSTISPGKIAMEGELPAKRSIPQLFDEMDYQQALFLMQNSKKPRRKYLVLPALTLLYMTL